MDSTHDRVTIHQTIHTWCLKHRFYYLKCMYNAGICFIQYLCFSNKSLSYSISMHHAAASYWDRDRLAAAVYFVYFWHPDDSFLDLAAICIFILFCATNIATSTMKCRTSNSTLETASGLIVLSFYLPESTFQIEYWNWF